VGDRFAAIEESFFRPALGGIVPYEPGKPVEEVERELGLPRVVKLASNEGPYGPFPEALDALERTAHELNRYPDGGCYRLRATLAELHDIAFEQVKPAPGTDALIDCLSQATLDPGDEIVLAWPSFALYAIYATKMGAVARRVPLRDHRHDLEAMLEAIGPRTKLLYIAHPNNPTGTMNTRAELDAYFARVPDHVLTVVDQAYFEYIDALDYPDAIEEYFKEGSRIVVFRTFSKIFGLAGLRVGYAIAHETVVRELGRSHRAFEVTTAGQEAALASLGANGSSAELERRRRLNHEGLEQLERIMRGHGLDPVVPAVGNFLFVEVGEDSRPLFEALLREGVIVRPQHGFGAPGALRVSVGTPEENEFFGEALGAVLARAPAG
jgi:histidinol-phosphate aminotransferase